jgi:acetyl esterase/lipase
MKAYNKSDELKNLYKTWTSLTDKNPNMSVTELREMYEHWGDVTGEPGGVDYSEIDIEGMTALWCVPKDCDQTKVVLCYHGGGFTCGSIYSHRKLYAHFARKIGCRALIIDYRRAPENLHPAQIDDAVKAYRWLIDNGIKHEHIAVTGDSCGGGLAITSMLRMREFNLPLPAASMLMSPWTDMEALGDTVKKNRNKDCLVQGEVIKYMAENFLGPSGNFRDPKAAPLYGDLTGLPPIYIQAGADEVLLSDAVRFADLATAACNKVKLDVFPGMQHVFQFLAGNAPEGDEAILKFAEWVRPILSIDRK